MKAIERSRMLEKHLCSSNQIWYERSTLTTTLFRLCIVQPIIVVTTAFCHPYNQSPLLSFPSHYQFSIIFQANSNVHSQSITFHKLTECAIIDSSRNTDIRRDRDSFSRPTEADHNAIIETCHPPASIHSSVYPRI